MPPTTRYMHRRSVTYPDPTLDAKGRPQAWSPTSQVVEEWGSLRVVFDGVDVTYLRDAPAIVEQWASAEPLGDTRAVIRFPQITPFDTLGAGDLAPIADWVNVEIKRLHADGATLTTLWEGMAADFADSLEGGLTVACLGALHQLGLYVRAPGISDEPLDIFTLIANEFATANRPALRTQNLSGTATGITSRVRGAWESPTEYIARLLDSAFNAGGNQWTVDHDRPRLPVLRLKDRTTEDWTVHVGQPGVVHDLRYDPRLAANVIYGEGVDQAGSRWRNSHPDQPAGYPFFQPVSYDPDVHGYDTNAAGDLVDNTARVVATKARIEALLQLGEGFGLTEGMQVADRQRATRVASWLGTVTFQADPQQGSRLQMRAGDNVRLRGFRSPAGVLVHVAEAVTSLDGDSYKTTCTVDQQGRDAALIDLIRDRNEEAKNPVGRLLVGHDSGANKDSQVPWDDEAGSGVMPNDATNGHRHRNGTSTVPLVANTWKVVRILASQRDSIVRTEFVTAPAAAFHVSVYDRFVAIADLPSNPFADGAWTNPPAGFIQGWGGFSEAAGYYPGLESQGAALTGRLVWEGTWQFNHDDVADRESLPYLWVAIRAKATTSIWGRLTRGVGYG